MPAKKTALVIAEGSVSALLAEWFCFHMNLLEKET
jgi:hypothetical protein